MRNRIAIAATLCALLVAIGGLAATIFDALGDEARPVASAPDFAPMPIEVGQKNAPMPSFVGPQLPEDDGEVDQGPVAQTPPANRQPPKDTQQKRQKWKPAVLQVVTNFAQADVKVNGLPYPEYYEPGEPEGMVLPAGGPYNVEVKFGNNTKFYNINLRAYETRLLVVELSGYNSGAPAAPPAKKAAVAKKEEPKKEVEKKEEKDGGGKITVYSKPAGTVITDGKETGEKTPGTVELANGRHEIQVKYETGSVSEKKIVRVRNGSQIKLFFRERK